MKQFSDYADFFLTMSGCLFYLWMAGRFCKEHLETSKKKEALFVFLSFGGGLLLDIGRGLSLFPYLCAVALEHLWFMGLVLWLFQAEREKKILAASMLMTVVTLVENFCVSSLSCLELFFQRVVTQIPNPVSQEWKTGLIGGISLCMAAAALYWLSKRLTSIFDGKSGRWYVLAAMPLLMIVIMFDMASWGASNGIMVRSGGNMGLYYDQIFSHAEFCVLSAICMLAAGFYLFGMDRIDLEQKKNGQYRAQITAYKRLEEQYSRSERLRHDLKNHVIALSGLWEEKDWERLGNYLKKMENSAELGISEEATGNRVVDALLYQKRKTAEEKGILWECDVQIPKQSGIHEFDLCVLFGNILDNAAEACERLQSREKERGLQPFIRIHAGTVKKCFLLEVKNSMAVEEQPGSGHSEKKNPQEHGIGLLNVRDVVDKYDGTMNVETKDGIFTISLLIPLGDAAHDIKRVV